MTRWYLAEIVQQITVAGDERAVVHINWVLVEAGSPDDAYAKALELGAQDQDAYANSTGRRVTVRFRGLRNLYVIHDALEHGAELLYEERVGLSETEIAALVRPKAQLGALQRLRARGAARFWKPLLSAVSPGDAAPSDARR